MRTPTTVIARLKMVAEGWRITLFGGRVPPRWTRLVGAGREPARVERLRSDDAHEDRRPRHEQEPPAGAKVGRPGSGPADDRGDCDASGVCRHDLVPFSGAQWSGGGRSAGAVAHHSRNWPVRRSQNSATKPRAKPMARKTQVRTIVSGSVAISTAIQMMNPTPRAPVSHGALQWRRTLSAAAANMATPLIAIRYSPGTR